MMMKSKHKYGRKSLEKKITREHWRLHVHHFYVNNTFMSIIPLSASCVSLIYKSFDNQQKNLFKKKIQTNSKFLIMLTIHQA